MESLLWLHTTQLRGDLGERFVLFVSDLLSARTSPPHDQLTNQAGHISSSIPSLCQRSTGFLSLTLVLSLISDLVFISIIVVPRLSLSVNP